eukprot:CAMPEP_0183306024 /NCGR_PEP_ID=MMETSP0160_2-20130417/10574_1 /TAXON_ID=2839 ORGANISM="Odontella Sinensis, Strain Grunow 1884" /NCGR_SAMPLE_ID=MMETSP0160_2 /ASSEMBLY_ACC=CAM_ASM_000250 /LENGTH=371 /DNA_ID=CAMNT_0025469325 /DNA_START=68 /DNA_END=1183 /DNA_ORIENTATION=+
MGPQLAARAAALLAVFVGALLSTAPGFPEWSQRTSTSEAAAKDDNHRAVIVHFLGGDGESTLSGRLTLPPAGPKAGDERPPVIVLSHGLGLSQDCGLDPFVEAFAGAGFASFTFDYATFGASGGSPRHVVNPAGHVADLSSAVRTVRERAGKLGVDGERIGLWGTSLGGGHALLVAAASSGGGRDDGDELVGSVRAVVAQVPHLASGLESVTETIIRDPLGTLPGLARVVAGFLRGLFQAVLSGRPWYIPLVGLPGSAAMMQNDGDEQGYLSLIPEGGGRHGWRNGATIGSIPRTLAYRPLGSISDVRVPALLVAAGDDTLCPAHRVERAAKLAPNAELVLIEGAGHFDIYSGDSLSRVLKAEIAFFQMIL